MAKESSRLVNPKEVASHPKYEVMIQEAIVTLNERKGSSRQAIKNYILTTYKLPDNNLTNKRLRLAVKKGVNNGLLFFPNGPSGTIKLIKKEQIKKEKEEPEKKEKPSFFQNGPSDTIKYVMIKKE
ncbi:14877_t:CDS:2, partial [Funneliformis caledonium]